MYPLLSIHGFLQNSWLFLFIYQILLDFIIDFGSINKFISIYNFNSK